ncbi:docking domain of Afi1 for Arf3 in vesicle trafficking-domain-containing protein [Paraphysoderma sedebokerense]|nr:docking domain of Afi1 for Arf3 in vesicle trafficking-domain-containing protein [Paraphysoderma sedebokerense]
MDKYVCHIILAEFDIKGGSCIAHQYPSPTGTSEQVLAELMLPDGAHNREMDWTVFFLNQRAGSDKSDLTEEEEDKTRKPLLHCLNLVRTKHDSQVTRGALVKAMAICARPQYVQIYKPLLILALEKYFENPSVDVLASLYNAANSMDVSTMPRLSDAERILLRQSENNDILEHIFRVSDTDSQQTDTDTTDDETTGNPNPEFRQRAKSDDALIHTLQRGNQLLLKRNSIPALRGGGEALSIAKAVGKLRNKDRNFYETKIVFDGVKVPIRIPLACAVEEVGDFSIIKLINTFSPPANTGFLFPGPFYPELHTSGATTPPIILLMNALLTQKRVLFVGYGRPSGEVAEYVLASCALASGNGSVLRGFTEKAFPYTCLANVDMLLKCPGYIAGVTNPFFEEKPQWWDVLCNVVTGKIRVSPQVQLRAPSPQEISESIPPSLKSPSVTSPSPFSSAPSSPNPSSPSISSSTKAQRSFSLINRKSKEKSKKPDLPSIPISRSSGSIHEEYKLSEEAQENEEFSPVSSPQAGNSPSKSENTLFKDGSDAKRIEKWNNEKWMFDVDFMAEIHNLINSHLSELHIRTKFQEYIHRFVSIASIYELERYGTTKIGFTPSALNSGKITHATDEYVLGMGPVFGSAKEKRREVLGNVARIEAWRGSRCYGYYVKDFEHRLSARSVKQFDIHHQITKLKTLQSLEDREVHFMYQALLQHVTDDAQITELLSYLPPTQNGLFPISIGLLHSSSEISRSTTMFLLRLESNVVGSKMISLLNGYMRRCYERCKKEWKLTGTGPGTGVAV